MECIEMDEENRWIEKGLKNTYDIRINTSVPTNIIIMHLKILALEAYIRYSALDSIVGAILLCLLSKFVSNTKRKAKEEKKRVKTNIPRNKSIFAMKFFFPFHNIAVVVH